MRLKLTCVFFILCFWANAQVIERFEVEPFFNPLFLQVGSLEKSYVKEINEDFASVTFNKKRSVEFGAQINYLISERFFVGTGISWWKQEYDFLIGINKDLSSEALEYYYYYSRPRNIRINYQNFRLYAGYRFKFNSEIKFEYMLNKFRRTKHNVAESIFSRDVSIGGPNKLRFSDRENVYVHSSRRTQALGVNYSVSIYRNLRIQLGFNWLIYNKNNSPTYSYENKAKEGQGIDQLTLLDLKIGWTQEYFFYTGFTYRFNYKKK